MNDKYVQLVENKNICLIGCGKSAEMCDINFDKYDLVVGINRLYKNSFFNKRIDILYHNVSFRDNLIYSMPSILNSHANRYIILLPSTKHTSSRSDGILEFVLNYFSDYNIVYDPFFRDKNREKYKTDLFTGVLSLMHLLEHNPKTIDIYGMDFYEHGYINSIPVLDNQEPHIIFNPSIHNLSINFQIFQKLIENNKNINNIQP